MINLLRRVWHLVNRSRRERELVAEMNEHREQMQDASQFGNTHRLIEQSRDAWGWNWLDDASQELRLGIRGLSAVLVESTAPVVWSDTPSLALLATRPLFGPAQRASPTSIAR